MGADRTVLVTGSSGYVGRRLVARLAERGTPVRALVHRSRHDLLLAVDRRCVIDDPMTQQGPILHQSKHCSIPLLSDFCLASAMPLMPPVAPMLP